MAAYLVPPVADWSRAEVGYTNVLFALITRLLRIGHGLRLVTLVGRGRRARASCGLVTG